MTMRSTTTHLKRNNLFSPLFFYFALVLSLQRLPEELKGEIMIPDNIREQEFPDDPLECKYCKFVALWPDRELKCPKHSFLEGE